MYKYYLFLYVIIAFLSCSKDGDEYDTHSCRVEIKEGSSFLLYTKLGNPVEELVFEKNTILFGKKISFSDKNQCLYQIDHVNKYFKKSGWYTQFTKFYYPDDLYYSPNTSDTELLRYLTAHKNDDYIEDLEVKGEQ